MEMPQVKLYRFNSLTTEIMAAYHELSRVLGMSDSVAQVLYTLYEHGEGCTQNDICRRTGLSRQTIHSAVRTMEMEGLLEKSEGKGRPVQLTSCGREYMHEKIVPMILLENEVLQECSPEDFESCLNTLEQFLRLMKQKTAGLARKENMP